MLKKINDKGQFLRFPGISVLSKTIPEDREFWFSIYQILNETYKLKQSFALLPSKSYHMTTHHYETGEQFSFPQWKEFVLSRSSLLQALAQELIKASIKPKIVLEGIRVSSVIQLIFTLNKDAYVKIIDLAEKFQLVDSVPTEFHMTLAYQYSSIAPDELRQITADICEKMIPLFRVPMKMEPPRLCTFEDMTEFTPWNGEGFPFKPEELNSDKFFKPRSTVISNGKADKTKELDHVKL